MTFVEGSQLVEIGENAFYNTSIAEVQIPSSVQTIRKGAFGWCDNLKRVSFAADSQLREIKESAFSSTKLAKVQIPANV